MRSINRVVCGAVLWIAALLVCSAPASAQQRCDIPREARDIWHCENGFVIGPENVIIRLPIPETDPEALYNAGVEAAQREDWRIAIAYFTAAHQQAHLVPRYMYNLGLAHARAGHPEAAIAWLAAYLSAAPDAPNRAAVWRQISELEGTLQRTIDALWQRARQAAEALPEAGTQTSMGPQFLGRSTALRLFAEAQTRAAAQPDQHYMEQATDGWLYDQEGFEPQFRVKWRYRMEFPPSHSHTIDSILFAARNSGRAGMQQEAGQFTVGMGPNGGEPERLAALGQTEGALAQYERALPESSWQRQEGLLYGDNFVTNEAVAAHIAEVCLLANDLACAQRASALAQREVLPNNPYGGWRSVRIQALLLAERGQVAEAVQTLQVYVTQRYAGQINREWRNGDIASFETIWPFEPATRWSEERFDAVGVIAEYLVWRGRLHEALALLPQLDSSNAQRFAEYLRARVDAGLPGPSREQLDDLDLELLARATGGATFTADQRARIERQVVAARTVSGAGYDLEWWLHWIDRRQISYPIGMDNPGEPFWQAMALIRTPEALGAGLASIRANYEFDKDLNMRRMFPHDRYPPAPTWGHDVVIAITACPHNLFERGRVGATPLTCDCPPVAAMGYVWGSEAAYTDDSDICTAAVHAGAISAQGGGRVIVTPTPGLAAYPSSTRNGVTTLPYGTFGGSFTIRAGT